MTTPTPHIVAALLGPEGTQIDCDRCFELLDTYVELQLDGDDADASTPGMRTHLAGCPACGEEHESLRALVAVAREGGRMTTATLQPQEWHEVTAPPPELAAAAEALAARFGAATLATRELCELVASLAARPDLWAPLIVSDRARRRYRLLYEDPRLDIWVLSWMPGQATGYHDHGTSNVALTALRGVVLERQIRVGRASSERELRPGSVQPGPAGYIHSVAHSAGAPAVTLHAYSPPLFEVGQYRAGPGDELLRERQHGRQELLDHTIGEDACR